MNRTAIEMSENFQHRSLETLTDLADRALAGRRKFELQDASIVWVG